MNKKLWKSREKHGMIKHTRNALVSACYSAAEELKWKVSTECKPHYYIIVFCSLILSNPAHNVHPVSEDRLNSPVMEGGLIWTLSRRN